MLDPEKLHCPVHVIGAGGIGIVTASALFRSGVPVQLIEANPAKRIWAKQHGIVTNNLPGLPIPIQPFEDWNPQDARLIILCVKSYDNAKILARLGTGIPLVPIQNGFDNTLMGHSQIPFEGIASFVSECDPDKTRTRITRRGHLHLGPLAPSLPGQDCLWFRDRLVEGGMDILMVPWILPYKHTKLLYNAAISPITSVGGISNAELLQPGPLRQVFFRFLAENYRILHGAGQPMGTIGPFHPDTVQKILGNPWVGNLLARFFKPSLENTYCSMFNDVQKGFTEIQNYNGYLCQLADQHGLSAPWNREAVRIIERLASERSPGSQKHLSSLLSLLP